MVDAPDLGSGAARRESSSLSRRTIQAFVAQLDRAQYYGYWGWEFESLRVYIMELWRSWCARWTENPKEMVRFRQVPLKSYTMSVIIEKINKWFRDNYDIKVDYSTMTITIKKKNNE